MQQDTKKIEKKIRSVGKISKITNAMKIISAMKTRKLKNKIRYTDQVLTYLITAMETLEILRLREQPTMEKRTSNQTLWIIYSSDLGLCGSYNTQLFEEWKKVKKNQDNLVIIGQKGINYFKFRNQSAFFSSLSHTFDSGAMKKLMQKIFEGYPTRWSQVGIIYARHFNMQKIQVESKILLPVEITKTTNREAIEAKFVIEPDLEVVYQTCLEFYLEFFAKQLFFESRFAEEVARRLAMEKANENAREMVQELKLKYNQIRQEKITREILTILQN